MEMKTFIKKLAIWVAVIAAAIIAVIGLCFGKVIEGSLFAEIAKWLFMGVIIICILEAFVYLFGPLIWHWTIGRKQ